MKLKSNPFIALTVLFSSLSASAGTIALNVDPAHSSIGFDIKHLVVASVHGNFTEFDGKIQLDDKNFTKSKIEFTVQTASISTNNVKRDGHLKSADFFDAEKFPTATFKSTAISKTADNQYSLEGDLSIHGKTQKTKFILLNLGKIKDPYGVEKYIFQASTTLKRKDFNLTYNATLESGGVVIGEDVKLTIDLEAQATK